MADTALEVLEQGGGFGGDDSAFKIGTSKVADGFKGAPGSLDKNLGVAANVADGNSGSEIAGDSAKFRQDVF